MVKFIFGFNIQTLLLVIFIIILLGLIIFGIVKSVSNKKSKQPTIVKIDEPTIGKTEGPTIGKTEEPTKWTADSYDELINKIKSVMNPAEVKTVEKYSESLESESLDSKLLECVTNKFTLEYNDPKFINDSDFNSKVEKIRNDCNNYITNPKFYTDPDPGPPFWSTRAINKLKDAISKDGIPDKITKTVKYALIPTQLDCIVNKIIAKYKNPRQLNLKNDQTHTMIVKIMEECKDNSQLDQDMLKFRIILKDSSILNTKGLLSCVTEDIGSKITNLDDITQDLLETSKNICKNNVKLNPPWPVPDVNKLKSDMSVTVEIMLGKRPQDINQDINQELNCIVDKIVDIFKSPQEFENLKRKLSQNDLLTTFNKLIIMNCLSLWTSDNITEYTKLIKDKLMPFDTSFDMNIEKCILDNIKDKYKNPEEIPKDLEKSISFTIIKDMYEMCTGKKELEPNSFDGMTDDEIKEIISKNISSSSAYNVLPCVFDNIKKNPSDKTIPRIPRIHGLYKDCSDEYTKKAEENIINFIKHKFQVSGFDNQQEIDCVVNKMKPIIMRDIRHRDFSLANYSDQINKTYQDCFREYEEAYKRFVDLEILTSIKPITMPAGVVSHIVTNLRQQNRSQKPNVNFRKDVKEMYFKFLYTPENVTKLKNTLIPKVMRRIGYKGKEGITFLTNNIQHVPMPRNDHIYSETELECIITKMKTNYNGDPLDWSNENDLVDFFIENIRECLWTPIQVERIKTIMKNMTSDELAIFHRHFMRSYSNKQFTNKRLVCFIGKLKEYFPDPNVFNNAADLNSISLNIFDRCDA